MILPMHFVASSARAISPITGVIVVASGMADISPFDLVKRTFIPMMGSCITIVAANFILFL
jgi:DcuC family C4-dicarboxylate transporter